MGIQSSKNPYSFHNHYYIVEDSFPADNYYKLQSKLTDELFIGREIQSLNKQDVDEIEYIINEKLRNSSPFVTKLLNAERDQEEGICETTKKFHLLYREIPKLLEHEIQDRRHKRMPFSAEQILTVLIRVAKGIKYLYDIGHYHGNVCETTIAWPSNPHESIQLIDEWALRDKNRKIKSQLEKQQSESVDKKNVDRANDLHSLGLVIKNMMDFSPNLQRENSPIAQSLKHKLFILLSQNYHDRYQIYNMFSQQDHMLENSQVMRAGSQSLNNLQASNTHGQILVNQRMNNNYNNYTLTTYPPEPTMKVGASNSSYNLHNNVNIRRSRVTQVKNQVVAAQPTVNFNNNNHKIPQPNYLTSNPYPAYNPPRQYLNTGTVNFGSQSQSFKVGSNYQPPKLNSTPSGTSLNFNTNYVTPTFTTSINEANFSKVNLQQFNPEIPRQKNLAAKPTQSINGFEHVYIKQKFDHTASGHLPPYKSANLPTVNTSSQPFVVNSFANFSPTFASPTFTNPSAQSSSLFSFQDSFSSGQNKSSDNNLFTSPDFFSKISGTGLRIENKNDNFNNIKIEDHQNTFQPQKIQTTSLVGHQRIKSPEVNHSLTRMQNTVTVSDGGLISKQAKQNASQAMNEFPPVNTSSQFASNQHLYVTVIPQLNQQSEGEDIDKDREYVVEQYENGSRYEGEKLNGLRDGQGKFYYKEGSYYDGHWKTNNMHGFGRLYYPNHRLAYEGDWFVDQFHGHGKVYNDQPAIIQGPFDYTNFQNIEEKWKYYEGTLVCDSKQGFGKLVLSNDEYYEGNFQGDRLHGEGKFVNMYGETIRGVWNESRLIKINDF